MGEGATRPVSVLWAHLGPCWPLRLQDKVLSHLPPGQAERALRYHRWQDIQAFLLGRLLLTEARKRAGLPTRLDEMTWSRTGRPALPGPGDFNISHAGAIVACALSMTSTVGLDVEHLRPGLRLADLLPVLSTRERILVARSVTPLQTALRFWCQKESITKAEGGGMTVSPLPDCSSQPVFYAGRQWSTLSKQRGTYTWSCASEGLAPLHIVLARCRFSLEASSSKRGNQDHSVYSRWHETAAF